MQQHSTAQPSPAQHSTQHSTAQHSTASNISMQNRLSTSNGKSVLHTHTCQLDTLEQETEVHLQCPGQLQLLHHLDQGAGIVSHTCLVAWTQLELTHKGGQLRPVADEQGRQCQAVTQIAVKVGHPLCRCWQCLDHSKLVVSGSNRGKTAKATTIDSSDPHNTTDSPAVLVRPLTMQKHARLYALQNERRMTKLN